MSQGTHKAPWGRLAGTQPLWALGVRGRTPSSQPGAGQGDVLIAHRPGPCLTVGSQGQLQAATAPTWDPLTCFCRRCSQSYHSSHQLTFHCPKVISQSHTPARCELTAPPRAPAPTLELTAASPVLLLVTVSRWPFLGHHPPFPPSGPGPPPGRQKLLTT